MNQFDEFFEKKLNDEQQFAGQKRSWTQINHDLQAFEIGTGIAAKSLALWKTIGIVAVLSAVALVWDRQHLVRENNKLKASVQYAESHPNPGVVPAPKVQIVPQKQETVNASPAPQHHVESTGGVEMAETGKFHRQIYRASIWPAAISNAAGSTNPGVVPTTLPYPTVDAPVSGRNQDAGDIVPEATNTTRDAKAVSTVNAVDQVLTVLPQTVVPVESITAHPHNTPQRIAEKPAAHASIDPVRVKDKRWGAGVRFVTGFAQPNECGISPLVGQGISASYRVWRGFSLTASADFLHFDVDTDTLPVHFADVNPPPPSQGPGPGPWHHFMKLKNVTTNQDVQQYNLGVRYQHVLIGRWKTSVNAAHSWVHMPSRLVSFRFEDDMPPHGGGHPDEEYFTSNSIKRWVSNVWRAGLGVQFDTPRWSFGVNGEYSKRFDNSVPSFSALFASAEAVYKF